jgi:hypothetical protein
MELIIYYPNPDDIKVSPDENNITSPKIDDNKKIDVTVFPTGAEYGSPIKM